MNFHSNSSTLRAGGLMLALSYAVFGQSVWAAPYPTGYTNTGSIINTRHNLLTNASGGIVFHNNARNNYGEVCVYCHTPHAANQTANGGSIAMPLWNRTIKITNYQTYDELGTSTRTQDILTSPGPASLTCLSCHDGQTAIDSIINMPGFGKGLASQQTTQSTTFLNNSWNNAAGSDTTAHRGINSTNNTLGNGTGSDGIGCLACHSPEGLAATLLSVEGNDMRLVNIGTNLMNDHPIGVTFPTVNGPGTDWNSPGGTVTKGSNTSKFFDDGDGKMEKAEIRTYEGRVECASCHDPHGVPGGGGVFKPTFLRVENTGSAVCLTCHIK